ncbi:hypothetical protein diail_7092 [Diaporthe ilicicola]|nr:hypothetical protein diail_7092 [Diaporthe ilicicola]
MTTEDVPVPLLQLKQDAFNFIKRHLESPFKDTGDSVMATIGCLMLLETAPWETGPDALLAVVMHLNGLVTAANHHFGPVVTAELTIFQRFLGTLHEHADQNWSDRAVRCVKRSHVEDQLSSMVNRVERCTPRCVLFIGLSSKPTDAWWCADGNTSANLNRGLSSLSTVATDGQRQDPGVTSIRMIAYMYLGLVLRPGRMSNEILDCLMDSIGTDTEGFERRAMDDDSAEQAALFWSLMLARTALASMKPLSGHNAEKLHRRQRVIDKDIRKASAILQLQTWPAAVAMLERVAFIEFEGEHELSRMWIEAVSNADQ